MSAKRHLFIVILIWAIFTAVGEAAALLLPITPFVASREGEIIDEAFTFLTIAAIPVFVLILVFLLYSVIRFRRRGEPAEDGPPITEHRALEISWVVISLLLVLGLAAFGWSGLNHILAADAQEDLVVQVEGRQWFWRFNYPKYEITTRELYLPINQVTRLDIISFDVIHSFWVPAFRMKKDAVPGMTTTMRVMPTELGTYESTCAELCGLGHRNMRAQVVVVTQREFEAWVAEQVRAKSK